MKKTIIRALILQVLFVGLMVKIFTDREHSVSTAVNLSLESDSLQNLDVTNSIRTVSSKISNPETKKINNDYIESYNDAIVEPIEEHTTYDNNIIDPDSLSDASEELKFDKKAEATDEQEVVVPVKHSDGSVEYKRLKFFTLRLSKQEKLEMDNIARTIENQRLADGYIETSTPVDVNNLAVDIGMANVPVLDQGSYNTCLTFATTAALEAKMNSGDYISQQALLELGVDQQSKLEKMQKDQSGWNGWTTAYLQFNRLEKFGVVEKKGYAHAYGDKKASLSEASYTNLSNKLWAEHVKTKKLVARNLDQIKEAVNSNHRVVMSIKLHKDFLKGEAVNNSSNGLWSLPSDLKKFTQELYNGGKLVGHAVIVTGYDDEKKLLKVRNSWGKLLGVDGDFYMTYDYFNLMSFESIELL